MDKKKPIFERLWDLFQSYRKTFMPFELHEVHIEKMPRMVHHYTIWSVGVIGASFIGLEVNDDIPVKSWQKFVEWTKGRELLSLYKDKVKSEDELAAIGMGLWFLDKQKALRSDDESSSKEMLE